MSCMLQSKRFENTHDADQPRAYASKENIPPNRQTQKETAPVKQPGGMIHNADLECCCI